jgi:TPR repeat
MALRPNAHVFQANLAEAYRALGDFERAAGCCRAALQIWPDYPEALCNLGAALQGLGQQTEASSGASGTLSFATAALPSPLSSYLLDGNSQVEAGMGFIPGDPTLPATSILPIADFINTGNGIAIPSSANLLSLTFTASSNAQGTFQIMELPDPNIGSYWFSGSGNIVSFGNSPFGPHDANGNPTTGTAVSIGSVTLSPQQGSVPEPQSVWLLLGGLATLVTYHGVRQFRLR